MKIPIFEEILLSEITAEKLRILVSDSRIGRVPSYINLTSLKKEEVESMVSNLEQIIIEKNLHPLFPYPLYIVSPYPVKSIIPTVKSVKELPEHYFKKIKRPNNKELGLLNKLSLKVDKIKNLDLFQIINSFRHTRTGQRTLYNETKELYFLENLAAKILEKEKDKSKK